jgi:hypothetical protein
MALAFAEDVERNLVGELPVSVIVQMLAVKRSRLDMLTDDAATIVRRSDRR